MYVLEIIWETIERNRTKEIKCIIKDIIRWKIPWRSKKTFQISTYIFNGWKITKIILRNNRVLEIKQKSIIIIISKEFFLILP